MKLLVFGYFLFTLFFSLELPVIITGNVVNHQNQAIKAKISLIKTDTQELVKTFESQSDGSFIIQSDLKNINLKFECAGYRAAMLPIEASQIKLNRIVCQINLIKEDFQAEDKAYQQSTTKDYNIDNIADNVNAKSFQSFSVVDAYTNEQLSADIALFPTRTKSTVVRQTDAKTPEIEIVFDKKDIVAFEVSAQGYQKYFGNLIIENLDMKKHKNVIRLIRELSMLNISLANSTISKASVSLVDESNKKITLIMIDKVLLANLYPSRKYKILLGNKLIAPEFEAKTGINQYIITASESGTNKQEYVGFEKKFLIYFEQSSYELVEDSKRKIDSTVNLLKDNSALKVEIIGHTDNIGNTYQNQYLSEFRASKISNLLFNQGIDKSRMKIGGKGSKQPLSSNATEAERKRNRRVEVKIYSD
ncbi:OmpA family protein [Emticicia soli]|uniref:OmpA family protein n=1 Tax=Emticicia soli TaxID=2027878 RepID=A0ABW5J6J4_9BACT